MSGQRCLSLIRMFFLSEIIVRYLSARKHLLFHISDGFSGKRLLSRKTIVHSLSFTLIVMPSPIGSIVL